MSATRVAALAAALACTLTTVASAQTLAGSPADSAEMAFLDLVRRGTERFASRDAAIRAGYRAVGGDFPAMGRHWVHPGVILRGGIDPENPAILSYAEISGVPRLVGVAFTTALAPGEEPPPIAGARRKWHEHNGSVAEESLVGEHSHGAENLSTRLAILHVWSGVENPAGTFATDNWALPFLRAGFPPPRGDHPAAARAIALLSGGGEYYSMLVGAEHPRAGDIRRILDLAACEARLILASDSSEVLRPTELTRLEVVWAGLVRALEKVAGESVRPLLTAQARTR